MNTRTAHPTTPQPPFLWEELNGLSRVMADWPRRRQARALALLALYAGEMHAEPVSAHDLMQQVLEWISPVEPRTAQRAQHLVAGVQQHRAELDGWIEHYAEHWSLNRISPITRNILRIALFEYRYDQLDLPLVIYEAIELAKTFAEEDAFRFIHGILDRCRSPVQ